MNKIYSIKYFLIVAIFALTLQTACQKKTCPAYHSVFILHEEDQHAYFSPFGNDSLPIVPSWGKKANGLANGLNKNQKQYKKRHYTVKMKDYLGEPEEEYEFETSATDIDNVNDDNPIFDDK